MKNWKILLNFPTNMCTEYIKITKWWINLKNNSKNKTKWKIIFREEMIINQKIGHKRQIFPQMGIKSDNREWVLNFFIWSLKTFVCLQILLYIKSNKMFSV